MSAAGVKMINLYSDTQTLPTEAMYDAMRHAELGDDQQSLDPTVNKLEALSASMLGKEAALLVPSGMMGNLCGAMSLANHGDEILIDPECHFWWFEAGSMCSVAGLTPNPVVANRGLIDPASIKAALRPRNMHFAMPKLLWLENTHNRAGGKVIPIDLHRQLCDAAHAEGLAVHLDGARIFNAQVASGVPAAEYAKTCDTVQFCLSKGLSCPVGSMLVGSAPLIDKARRIRKRMGGAMRQAGIFAAAGIVALQTMIDRLADDHANAKRLARGLADMPGLKIDLATVETNMAYVDVSGTGGTAADLAAKLNVAGVMASTPGRFAVRFVTHRHITPDLVDEALKRIRPVLV